MMRNKKPAIRFKGFTEEWEERKLGDITNCYSGGTPSVGNREFYGGDIPFIRSGEINDESTELFLTENGLQNSSAKYVEKGDILYALYGATSGEVGISQMKGAINQAILAIKPREGFNTNFVAHWLRKEKASIVDTYIQGGQGNLSGSIVKDLEIQIPSNNEQTQIGNFFKNLDSLITLHQRKYDKMVNVKKAMLEKMFPKNGADVPEIRFKGFEGAWEERTLGDLFGIASASRVHKHEWRESGVPFFRSSDVVSDYKGQENTKAFISFELYEELAKKSGCVQKNDILVTGGGSIGIPYLVKSNEPLYFKDADLLWLKNSDSMNGYFLYTFFSTSVFRSYVNSITHIGTISHYTIEQAKATPIKVPKREEQDKIGEYLTNLDKLLTLHQGELDKLKNLKKAMLEKMFV